MHVFARIQCIPFLHRKAEFSLALWILLAYVPLASQHTLMRAYDINDELKTENAKLKEENSKQVFTQQMQIEELRAMILELSKKSEYRR